MLPTNLSTSVDDSYKPVQKAKAILNSLYDHPELQAWYSENYQSLGTFSLSNDAVVSFLRLNNAFLMAACEVFRGRDFLHLSKNALCIAFRSVVK